MNFETGFAIVIRPIISMLMIVFIVWPLRRLYWRIRYGKPTPPPEVIRD